MTLTSGLHPIVAATDVVDTAGTVSPLTGAESMHRQSGPAGFRTRGMNGPSPVVAAPLNSCRRIYARQEDCVHIRSDRPRKYASTRLSTVGFVLALHAPQFADRPGRTRANRLQSIKHCPLVKLSRARQGSAMRVHSWSSERSQAAQMPVVVHPRT